MKHEPMIHAKPLIFLTVLAAAAAVLCSTGYAGGRHAKTKSKSLKPLPPGPVWVDTNKDGQLSNDELKRATQMLEQKMKEAQSGSAKAAVSPMPGFAYLNENGQLSDKGLERAEADLKAQFGKYLDEAKKSSEQKANSNKP